MTRHTMHGLLWVMDEATHRAGTSTPPTSQRTPKARAVEYRRSWRRQVTGWGHAPEMETPTEFRARKSAALEEVDSELATLATLPDDATDLEVRRAMGVA